MITTITERETELEARIETQGIVLRKVTEALLMVTAERDSLDERLTVQAHRVAHWIEKHDELKADAERYRWLRDAKWTEDSHPEVWLQLLYEYGELDAAIDAAMKGKS